MHMPTMLVLLTLLSSNLSALEQNAPQSEAVKPSPGSITKAIALQEHDVYADGLRIHVVEAGQRHANKPAIVLLHGWMASAKTYQELQPLLAKNFYVIAFDAPGFGQSFHPGRKVSSFYMARVTKAVLDAMQIKKAILFGESMGGMTALRFAALWPGYVEQLVLANPAGFNPGRLRQIGMRFLLQDSMYDSSPDWPFVLTMHLVCFNFGEIAKSDLKELQQRRRNHRWAFATATAYRDIRSGVLDKIAAKIKVPMTLMLGRHDLAFPKPYQDHARFMLPQAKVIYVEGAGHGLHADKPQAIIDLFNSFNFNN